MAVLLGDNTQVKGAIRARNPRAQVLLDGDYIIEGYLVTGAACTSPQKMVGQYSNLIR